jgi:hypothetical protein
MVLRASRASSLSWPWAIGRVEEGKSAQPVVDLTGLGDERRDLCPRPQVDAPGLRGIRMVSETVRAARRPLVSRPPMSMTISLYFEAASCG